MTDLLSGVRILSLNHFLLGPLGIQHLADLGADVIGVEPLTGAFQRHFGGNDVNIDGAGGLFHVGGRNKRSISLDLKQPEACEIVRHIVKDIDVVAENFRPGVMERFGLAWEQLKAINPKLIYASASGYGPDGPWKDKPGQDLLVQAISGLASINGTVAGGPRPVGVSVIDHHGAALYAMAILAGLVSRSRTGVGRRVEVDLLSAGIDLQAESLSYYLNGAKPGTIASQGPTAGWHNSVPYGIYATASGHLVISLASAEQVLAALEIDLDELGIKHSDADFCEQVGIILQDHLKQISTDECRRLFDEHHIWHAPVSDYENLLDNPQVKHNGNISYGKSANGEDFVSILSPILVDGIRPQSYMPPQNLGAQTYEILREFEFSEIEITDFIRNKVVT